jgi:hypothetical protein
LNTDHVFFAAGDRHRPTWQATADRRAWPFRLHASMKKAVSFSSRSAIFESPKT